MVTYPSSTSAQSINSLSTTVPASNSGQSVISLGSSTSSSHYETCPSDSPPPYRQRQHSQPLSPLPRPPTFNFNSERSRHDDLEGAFRGLAVVGQGGRRTDGEGEVSSRTNKPLPSLPASDNHNDSRQDPSLNSYRAGSSFTTVYHPNIVPTREVGHQLAASTGSVPTDRAGRGGAADLVLRRRDHPSQSTVDTSRQSRTSPVRVDRQQPEPTWQAPSPPPSHAPYSDRAGPSYSSQPTPYDRNLGPTYPNYQQQSPRDSYRSNQPTSQVPHPPAPYAKHRPPLTQIPFPTYNQPQPGAPPPPPDIPWRPYTSPPALPSSRQGTPTKQPREPSFSLLPPMHTFTPPPATGPTSSQSLDHASPSTPRPRPRAKSATPGSTAKTDGRVQCSGRNGTSGKRCGNRRGKNAGGVGSPSPRKLGVWKGDGKDLEEEEEEWYCHRHVGAILQNEGCYVGKVWVEFDGWIPPELTDETRIALMKAIERPPVSTTSPASVGYIYCFEYRGLSTSTYRTFKIGQSKNPTARLEQWGAQCPSHHPVLLGVCPSSSSSRMRGLRGEEQEGVKGSLWLEKLVHTEVQSFDPGVRTRLLCVDCGKFHQELFRIPRSSSSDEYEDVVEPVMDRWARFVAHVLGE